MENSDRNKKRETFPNLRRRNQQDITNQHLFDFFVALSGATEKQHRCGRRYDIGNANDRFLRNLARATQIPREAICAIAMSTKIMPRWTT